MYCLGVPAVSRVRNRIEFMPEKTLLPIGTIAKAHGIRGEVSVDYNAESPQLVQGELYLQAGSGSPARRKVASWRRDHARLLILFEGVQDRNAAELLRGATLLVPASALPPLSDGELYIHDLMGLAVFEVGADGSLIPLGRIADIASPAGQELWTIRTPDGRELLFPAVPEFVLDIDLEKGEARISPPPGLFDL